MQTSYAIEGKRQEIQPGRGDQAYACGGVVPSPMFERGDQAYPTLRFPWSEARAALLALSVDRPEMEAVQIAYINPENGRDAQNNLGFYALMLRPGQTLRLPVRSPAVVFHQIEGRSELSAADAAHTLHEADTCRTPGYTEVTLRNHSTTQPAFLFMSDESPLHRKLGVYETRG